MFCPHTHSFLYDMHLNLFCQRGNTCSIPVAEGGEDSRLAAGYCELPSRAVH
jgi:hypothetical protein